MGKGGQLSCAQNFWTGLPTPAPTGLVLRTFSYCTRATDFIFNHSNLRLRIDFVPLGFLKSVFPKTWIIVLLAVVGYLPFLLEHPRWWPQCLACKQHWVNVQFPCPVQLPLSTPLFLIPCSKSSYLLWFCLFCNDITGKVRAFSFGIHPWNPDCYKVLSLVDCLWQFGFLLRTNHTHMLGKCSFTELHPQFLFSYFESVSHGDWLWTWSSFSLLSS